MEKEKEKAEDEKNSYGGMKMKEGVYAHLQISRNSDIDVIRRRNEAVWNCHKV